MAHRIFMSNISKAWPRERQLSVLGGAAIDKGAPTYEDVLSRRGLQSSDPDLMVDRATMLRPTSRRSAETIWVASLAVLARTAEDLAKVFAAAAARHATIVSVSEGLSIPPDPHSAVLAQAHAAWKRGRLKAQTEGGRLAGVRISAEKRRAKTAAALDKVREDWGRPSDEVPTAALIERSGMTYKSLHEHLGPRKKAQKKQLLREQRAAKKEALNAEHE